MFTSCAPSRKAMRRSELDDEPVQDFLKASSLVGEYISPSCL